MSDETFLTIRGTLVADPELRHTPSGSAVANFRVAVNARKFDKQSGEWRKQPAKFWSCNAWNQGKAALAENVADVLKKGDTVLVYGELVTREYETREGEKRSADEIRVEAIGKDLRWHAATAITGASSAPSNGSWTPDGGNGGWGNASTAGGWGTGAAAPAPGDEPPF